MGKSLVSCFFETQCIAYHSTSSQVYMYVHQLLPVSGKIPAKGGGMNLASNKGKSCFVFKHNKFC